MKKIQSISIIVVSSFVLGACSLLPQKNTTKIEPAASPIAVEAESMQNDAMIPTDSHTSTYQDYSEIVLDTAVAENKTVVLFFHANWCPTCKTADVDITENLSDIPENVVVLKTDYDSEKELKKKYNVTYQHTFVQIDQNKEMVTSWNGGGASDIAKRIK